MLMPSLKMFGLRLRVCLLICLLPGQVFFSGLYADETSASVKIQKEKNETLSKLNLLGYILTKSKREKEVLASGNDKAIIILEMARKHYETAKMLLDKGEIDSSNDEIQKSLQNISVSFRMVVDKEGAIELAREQYSLLLSRVKNFRELFQQLPADKVKGLLDAQKLASLIKKAEALYHKNQPKQALEPLLDAADMLERALSVARKNETVVYALEFSSPEDEYKYELERNKNYTLLSKMLLSTSPPENKKKLPLIRMLINKNEQLVVEAEKKFRNGAVDDAILLLEKGNKTLIRALRFGGLAL
ncbi:MAG TPA: hypothetical protein ENI98_09585 [Gammaproteobacteria bacterium]|nr:hypothetical protein [Gammaproteobacteria bacterium]